MYDCVPKTFLVILIVGYPPPPTPQPLLLWDIFDGYLLSYVISTINFIKSTQTKWVSLPKHNYIGGFSQIIREQVYHMSYRKRVRVERGHHVISPYVINGCHSFRSLTKPFRSIRLLYCGQPVLLKSFVKWFQNTWNWYIVFVDLEILEIFLYFFRNCYKLL